LICHWYDGVVPPSVGVAVKVTLAPRHIDVWLAAIDTVGVTLVAVIVIALLVADAGVAHGSLLVMITLTWSLFARVVEVNVAAVSPVTVAPFTCHT
jgi:hypothetical protein